MESSLPEFVRLTLPKLVSQPLEPITILFFNAVASTLAVGSLSILSYARNFQSVPVSLVGVAFAVAAFPALSRAYAAGDRPRFRRLFGTNLASITTLTVGRRDRHGRGGGAGDRRPARRRRVRSR